jgi:hypothetical protein
MRSLFHGPADVIETFGQGIKIASLPEWKRVTRDRSG